MLPASRTAGAMTASAVFILDVKAKVIISRYRGDVPMNCVERFSGRSSVGRSPVLRSRARHALVLVVLHLVVELRGEALRAARGAVRP